MWLRRNFRSANWRADGSIRGLAQVRERMAEWRRRRGDGSRPRVGAAGFVRRVGSRLLVEVFSQSYLAVHSLSHFSQKRREVGHPVGYLFFRQSKSMAGNDGGFDVAAAV